MLRDFKAFIAKGTTAMSLPMRPCLIVLALCTTAASTARAEVTVTETPASVVVDSLVGAQ